MKLKYNDSVVVSNKRYLEAYPFYKDKVGFIRGKASFFKADHIPPEARHNTYLVDWGDKVTALWVKMLEKT